MWHVIPTDFIEQGFISCIVSRAFVLRCKMHVKARILAVIGEKMDIGRTVLTICVRLSCAELMIHWNDQISSMGQYRTLSQELVTLVNVEIHSGCTIWLTLMVYQNCE